MIPLPTPSSFRTTKEFIIIIAFVFTSIHNSLSSTHHFCSKVQARMAFSTYLHWVQMRLLAESRANTTSAWPEKDNDQMDLVMRFLKRAASNLQQDIRVVLPSHQLSLPDRRRILSHQLGEFIHCYNKETEQMMKYLEKIKDDDDGCINPNVFQEFILEASENDLEDVLTFYTHKNKSSSVFLGTKCQSSKANGNQEDSNGTGELAKHNSKKICFYCEHIHLQHCFPPSVLEPQPQAQPPPYVQPPPHPHAEPQSKPHPSGSSSSTNPVQPSHVMWASSNLRSTGSAATAEVLQRVHYSHSAQPSANGAVIAGTSNSSQINIHSQKLSRPSSAGESKAQAQSNQQAIVSALKTLVEKQAARQHNTSSHISLLTEHVSLTNLNLANGVFNSLLFLPIPSCCCSPRCEAVNAAHCQTACNRATEAGLQQNFQPTIGSYQLQFAIQQQKLQSMQLLDQSRTRHQVSTVMLVVLYSAQFVHGHPFTFLCMYA
uniref:Uncharacterized protein n=1 Tax=Electrophorus electricus TaxID=8005 RepID=A0A4W4H1P7_ELEEL